MHKSVTKAVEVRGEPEPLVFRRAPELESFFVLSPYALYRSGQYEMLVRLVNRDDDPTKKVSRIHYASSSDGITFDVGGEVISPGPPGAPDSAGCEDPSVVKRDGGYHVFYSGYDATKKASSMLGATGTALTDLAKTGMLLEPSDVFANPKEAAVIATPDAVRMFFEYSRDGASLIGVADAARLEGAWTYAAPLLEPRPSHFDSWHLSPSSGIRCADGTHILFYNGASKEAAWRVGYALLDETGRAVVSRSEMPLVSPFGLETDDSDIAFAASTVVDQSGSVWLYFSIADRKPYRVRLAVQGKAAVTEFD